MILLAIDPSIASTGYAIFQDNNLLEYGRIPTNKEDFVSDRARILFILNEIKNIINEYSITQVVYEYQYVGGKNNKNAIQLIRLGAMIDYMCYIRNLPCEEYPITSWRATLGIKGKDKKQATFDYVKEHIIDLGKLKTSGKMKNDDMCDAIAIGYSYLKRRGCL